MHCLFPALFSPTTTLGRPCCQSLLKSPKHLRNPPPFPSVLIDSPSPLLSPPSATTAFFSVLGEGKASKPLLSPPARLCRGWAQLSTVAAAVCGVVLSPHDCSWGTRQGGETNPHPSRLLPLSLFPVESSPHSAQLERAEVALKLPLVPPQIVRRAEAAGGEGGKGRGERVPSSMGGREDSYVLREF